jgi:anaerobic glycerol-3-phosphate dehydrogenase
VSAGREVTADVLVIGAGAAGVAAARAAHEAGATVAVVADGGGAAALGSGVAWGAARGVFTGWAAGDAAWRVGGRYVTVGGWLVEGAAGALASLLDVGALPAGGTPGVLDLATHPSWSARLVAQTLGARVIAAPDGAPGGQTFREAAAALDPEGAAEALGRALRPACEGLSALLLPPVLGLARLDAAARLSSSLGLPAGEAAGGPGDPPGMRALRALRRWLPDGVEVLNDRATVKPGRLPSLVFRSGRLVKARAVVLATGGLAGGGLTFGDSLREAAADAPVWTRDRERVLPRPGAARGADPAEWFDEHTGRARGAGVRVDAGSRVLDADGETALCGWLYAAGEVCSGRGGDGLADALADGARAGRAAATGRRG